MQRSTLLIFSCFALATTLGDSTSVPPFMSSSVSFTPLPPCTLGGNAACGTGSVCTPVTNCIGRCYAGVSHPTVLPTNNVPITATGPTCQVGWPPAYNGCSTGSYCAPTVTCAGLCLNTEPLPPATTTTPPISTPPPSTFIPPSPYNCVVNEFDSTAGCATSSFCTPVGPCYGICTTTIAPYGMGSECMVLDGEDCGPNAFCSQNAGCGGTCTALPKTTTHTKPTTTHKTTTTHKPTTTHKTKTKKSSSSTQSRPAPSGTTCGWIYINCESDYDCVDQDREIVGVGEAGVCVKNNQLKRRYLAGRYFGAGDE